MPDMPKVLLPNIDNHEGIVCLESDRLAQLRWSNNLDKDIIQRLRTLEQDPYSPKEGADW